MVALNWRISNGLEIHSRQTYNDWSVTVNPVSTTHVRKRNLRSSFNDGNYVRPNQPQITQFPRRAYHIKGNPINIKEHDDAKAPSFQ